MTRGARRPLEKAVLFLWRGSRNLLCVTPVGRRLLFPERALAQQFGPADADYAISVFLQHYRRLTAAGFVSTDRILEVGPGQNVGTALLMWAANAARSSGAVTVFLWDVFANAAVDAAAIAETARALLASPALRTVLGELPGGSVEQLLGEVAEGRKHPDIRQRVCSLEHLIEAGEVRDIGLVYSHAAIEHIWRIREFWRDIVAITRAPGGWHSHHIDLADHGRRDSNYVEMLEWSSLGYWLSLRFVPGGVNRWRASMHEDMLARLGVRLASVHRTKRDALPIPRTRLNPAFRSLDDSDLRTVDIHVVGIRSDPAAQGTAVLMFCPQFRPVVGGAERQAEKLATELVARGCRVSILTPRIDADSPAREIVNGVVIERFPFRDLASRFPLPGIALLNLPYILWQVGRAVSARLDGFDVVHGHIGSLQTVAALLAGRLKGVPVLCKIAIAGERSDLGEMEKGGPSGRVVAWLARRVIQTWVATTDAVEHALIRAGVVPDRIRRIPNGVPIPDAGTPRAAEGRVRRFLYLGRLSTNIQRDVPTLIAAFDNVARDHADIELAIVGAGDLFDDTRRLVESSAARARIAMPGFDRPETWLDWADCFVLPSRYEGLSNALLEAMALGLPCVANDIGPNREALADGSAGALVPIGDVSALESVMREFVERPDAAWRYGQLARKRAMRTYSIGAVAEHYIKLYQELREPA